MPRRARSFSDRHHSPARFVTFQLGRCIDAVLRLSSAAMHALLTVLVVMLLTRCCAADVVAAADLDHPHGFDPAKYPDRAAWERRQTFLRHQVLVAQGLWPMPEKSPLEPVVHGKIERDG